MKRSKPTPATVMAREAVVNRLLNDTDWARPTFANSASRGNAERRARQVRNGEWDGVGEMRDVALGAEMVWDHLVVAAVDAMKHVLDDVGPEFAGTGGMCSARDFLARVERWEKEAAK